MKTYAIAVRRSPDDLRLFARIARKDATDIYVNLKVHELDGAAAADWNPHSSYHASGQRHSKSFNIKMAVWKGQKPDQHFTGHSYLETTNADRMRWTGLPPCDPAQFDDIFEIPLEAVKKEPNAQVVSVDLIEPGFHFKRIPIEGVALLDKTFKDFVPWIVASLRNLP